MVRSDRTLVLSLCVTLLSGCSACDASGEPVLRKRMPAVVALDLVFVVDNSGSMFAEQQQLASGFPEFVGALQAIGGDLPDLHLGVLSSNAGSAGQASVPGCPLLGDDGNLLTGAPGSTCATDFGLQGTFISDVALPGGSRQTNYDAGQLAPLAGCMASLGTTGCGFEMHLESMFRALQPGKNAGFLRDEAWLGVVFLADEDDCSTEVGTMFGDPTATLTSPLGPRTSFRCHEFGVVCDDDPDPRAFGPKIGCRQRGDSPYMYEVERYVGFLQGLKADPGRVVVAGIFGDFDATTGRLTVGPDVNDATFPAVERSCHTADPADPNDGATPAVRLQAFLSAFPGRSTSTSICTADLGGGMLQIAGLLKSAIGDLCIDRRLLDADPAAEGVQPECTVTDVVGAGTPGELRQAIPQCPQAVQPGTFCDPGVATTPCWCIHPDAAQCPAGAENPESHAADVNRGGTAAPAGAVVEVACLLD